MIKKFIFPIFFIMAILLFPASSQAMDFSLGGTAWYAVQVPVFRNLDNSENRRLPVFYSSSDEDGAFLFGPLATLKISNEWEFSAALLFGLNRNEFHNEYFGYDFYYNIFGDLDSYRSYTFGDSEARRVQTELELRYTINNHFKFLIDVKHFYYSGDGDEFRTNNFNWLLFSFRDYKAWALALEQGSVLRIPYQRIFLLMQALYY